jgi:hypothetical protein
MIPSLFGIEAERSMKGISRGEELEEFGSVTRRLEQIQGKDHAINGRPGIRRSASTN